MLRLALISLCVSYACAQSSEDTMAELTRIIDAGNGSARIYNLRGSENFKLGRIDESIADFDKAVEMQPASDPHHWQRGISYYYAGRFKDGREQFERHQTVNPNDVENGVWHFLCATRELGLEEARQRLLPISGDPRVPMREIYQLFRGEIDVDAVLQATNDENSRFYGDLYIGLYYEAIEDAANAKLYLTRAAGRSVGGHYMWQVARVHAQRLVEP